MTAEELARYIDRIHDADTIETLAAIGQELADRVPLDDGMSRLFALISEKWISLARATHPGEPPRAP